MVHVMIHHATHEHIRSAEISERMSAVFLEEPRAFLVMRAF